MNFSRNTRLFVARNNSHSGQKSAAGTVSAALLFCSRPSSKEPQHDGRGPSGSFRSAELRSRAGAAQIERSSPAAPDRPRRHVVVNRICLACSAAARISPSAAQSRRQQRLAGQQVSSDSRKTDYQSSSAAPLIEPEGLPRTPSSSQQIEGQRRQFGSLEHS
jgi:hypothetical protein